MNFIADIGSNHNQDLERCLALIDTAAETGCSGVKFQLFKINKMYAPEILKNSKDHRDLKHSELPIEFIPDISKRCKGNGLLFCCTPFYLEAVEELNPYIDIFKIGSFELLWLDLIRACSQTGKGMILSTGMATIDEIWGALSGDFFSTDVSLMHCVSGYPVPVTEANLSRIHVLRNEFNLPIGYSDHTGSEAVISRAVHKWGVRKVEFHLDLDGVGMEYKHGHCWLPEEIEDMIPQIKQGLCADGDGSGQLSPCEISNLKWRADASDGLRPQKNER